MDERTAIRELMRLRKQWGSYMPPAHWPYETRCIAWDQLGALEAILPPPATEPLPPYRTN